MKLDYYISYITGMQQPRSWKQDLLNENLTNRTDEFKDFRYQILWIEGRPLAVDFCIFWRHCGQQAGHRRPVAADAATKFEHCSSELYIELSLIEVSLITGANWPTCPSLSVAFPNSSSTPTCYILIFKVGLGGGEGEGEIIPEMTSHRLLVVKFEIKISRYHYRKS